MNSITLIGYVGAEPEGKTTKNGKAATTISIGNQRKDANGQKTTDWFDCIAYGKTGEVILQYVHKGDKLGVVGEVQIRKWNDKETGHERKMYIVLIDKIEFISSKKQDEPSGTVPFEV